MREVRFSVGPDDREPVTNSYAGWPTARGIQPYLVFQAIVAGEPDPRTGYLVNISTIDRLLRQRAIPLVHRPTRDGSPTGEQLLRTIADDLAGHAPSGARWVGWRLCTTPFIRFAIDAEVPDMIQVTQSFEFAAAHRLHCPEMTAEENRSYFGKCNNPNGHGHNYRLEVTIAGEPDETTATVLPMPQFERIVNEQVIDRFDHKHLNQDCPEFASLNPSVENIAAVIWRLLDGRLAPAKLHKVRVWETPKTYAEYTGE